MALSKRSTNRFQSSIWPGFVDAMTGLLLVLMFVLTVFTVIQFTLNETIHGQESQLNELTAEVATLAQALGLERGRSADLANQVGTLSTDLSILQAERLAQADLIASLTLQRDQTLAALDAAENRITGFEAQVAGLLSQRSELRNQIAGLQDQQEQLISEAEALNLALAQARSEIDESSEAARLAAARREALETYIASLEADREIASEKIDALEAQRLMDAAAADALRKKLADAGAELTAMTLALEEQRSQAEETLSLLAAAEAAKDALDRNLAAALLAQQQAENDLLKALQEGQNLDERLLAALSLQETTAEELALARDQIIAANEAQEDLATRLAAALAAGSISENNLAAARSALEAALANNAVDLAVIEEKLAAALLAKQAIEVELAASVKTSDELAAQRLTLEERLAEALIEQQALETQVQSLSDSSSETVQQRANLEARLAEALAALSAARAETIEQLSETERRDALLATAQLALSEEKAISTEAQRQVAVLNQNVNSLRQQVTQLQQLLDLANEVDSANEVQITNLSQELNQALARAATESARRLQLEEAERRRLEEERIRLEAQTQDLEQYRSEFFGRLREVLAGQDGIRIEGDRFVFSSEVLFPPAGANLSSQGKSEIAKVASILRNISSEIPDGIDWIIRVDGHTDNTPLSGAGIFANNWELSQARALSVVLYMIEQEGISPERLSANGFGEFQPVNDGNTEDALAQNRRIELKLTER